MNPWEACALEYQFPSQDENRQQQAQPVGWTENSVASDSLIYPGLYCPSGTDIMSILFRVATRPNPQIELGAVDCSVALLVCDLQQPDIPIVYASEPFIELTGYAPSEIVGRNCRFLQAPGGAVQARSVRQHVDRDTVRRMRKAVEGNTEVQLRVNNFKRDGRMFVNLLTIIPVTWDTEQFRYSVGFQCEVAA